MALLSPILRLGVAALLLAGLALAPACGSDETKPGEEPSAGAPNAGASGAGGSNAGGAPSAIECGATTCEPQPILDTALPACCAPNGACGIDASALGEYGPAFEEPCQERDQPGALDPGCPASAATEVPDSGFPPISFPGCCRPDEGRCGYMVQSVFGLITIGLGCVDSEPFLDGATPMPCDPNAPGGSAGAGGVSGAENTSGAAGAN
jgi:hypothetical protein